MNRKNYVNYSVYSAERYDQQKEAGRPNPRGVVSRRIIVGDRTREEIDKLIQEDKDNQARINDEYYRSKKDQQVKQKQLAVSGQVFDVSMAFDAGTGNTFVLFGASKSGKTTLMMKIYTQWFKDHKKWLTTLFAMNPQINGYNTTSPSGKYIIKCSKFDAEASAYIDWQRKVNVLNNNKFNFLNMFDDFIDIRYSNVINNLILTYRNSNMSSIICLQYVKLLSKSARSNANNVFLLQMNTDESITDAIKTYLSSFLNRNKLTDGSIEQGIQWYRNTTENHNYIHIHPQKGFVYLSKTKELFKL